MREYIILKGKETLTDLEKYENILAVHLGIGCELRGKLLVFPLKYKGKTSYQ